MQQNIQSCNCALLVHEDTMQFTAESRDLLNMHDLLNTWSRYISLKVYVCLKFQLRVHAKYVVYL